MKPLGQKPKSHNYKDHHMHDSNSNKIANWHDHIGYENKGGERAKLRDELIKVNIKNEQ